MIFRKMCLDSRSMVIVDKMLRVLALLRSVRSINLYQIRVEINNRNYFSCFSNFSRTKRKRKLTVRSCQFATKNTSLTERMRALTVLVLPEIKYRAGSVEQWICLLQLVDWAIWLVRMYKDHSPWNVLIFVVLIVHNIVFVQTFWSSLF